MALVTRSKNGRVRIGCRVRRRGLGSLAGSQHSAPGRPVEWVARRKIWLVAVEVCYGVRRGVRFLREALPAPKLPVWSMTEPRPSGRVGLSKVGTCSVGRSGWYEVPTYSPVQGKWRP